MKSISILTLAAIAAFAFNLSADKAQAHCQVPCGIYDDAAALAKMAQNAATVKKAIGEMQKLASATDAQSKQQFVRWTTNKESHAADTQQIALDYFLAQRIKLPADDAAKEAYNKHLGLLHEIIVHSMKCKQNADLEAVEALEKAIAAFTKAYNAK